MFCLETDGCRAVSRCFTSAEPKTLSCARSLAQEKDRVLRALFFTARLEALVSVPEPLKTAQAAETMLDAQL